MRKNQLIGAVAGGALAVGAVLAIQTPGGWVKSITDSSYQIGYMMGSFVGIGSNLIPSISPKGEGGSPNTFLSQDTLKYMVPILFILTVAGVFLGTGSDVGNTFTKAFTDGMFHFVWIGFFFRTFQDISTKATSGIGEGIQVGLAKRIEDKIRGKRVPRNYRDAKDFVDAMQNFKKWGGLATANLGEVYTRGGFSSDIEFLRQAKNVV